MGSADDLQQDLSEFDAPGAFHGPDCPQCGELMWRALIETDKPDHDRRTFECATFKRVEARKYRRPF